MSEFKYLINGDAVNVVAELENGKYLVENVYGAYGSEEDEEDYIECTDSHNPFIVNKVFENPPVQVQNEKINEQKAVLDSLEDNKKSLLTEIKEVSKELEATNDIFKNMLEKCRALKPLDMLYDIQDGKITHCIVFESSYLYAPYKIIEIGKKDESCTLSIEVSLRGGINGRCHLLFKSRCSINGTNFDVIPCRSYDDALCKLQDRINSLDNIEFHCKYKESTIDTIKKYNLKIKKETMKRLIEASKCTTDGLIGRLKECRLEEEERHEKTHFDFVRSLEAIETV